LYVKDIVTAPFYVCDSEVAGMCAMTGTFKAYAASDSVVPANWAQPSRLSRYIVGDVMGLQHALQGQACLVIILHDGKVNSLPFITNNLRLNLVYCMFFC
jgi:hypothetical protein